MVACLLAAFAVSGFATGPVHAADRPALGIAKGEFYPDFRLPLLDGEAGRLSDYRGKKIILFHFASW